MILTTNLGVKRLMAKAKKENDVSVKVSKMYAVGGWAGDETLIENIDNLYISVQGDLAFASLKDLDDFNSVIKDMLEGDTLLI